MTDDPQPRHLADNLRQPLLVADRPFERDYVIDAAVTRFGNCYVMVYTTGLPSDWGVQFGRLDLGDLPAWVP